MYTISYYAHTRTAQTPADAITTAKQLVATYGQGNRNPVIDADSEESAQEMERFQVVSQTDYCVRVAGEPVR